jgi:hypothetical protein
VNVRRLDALVRVKVKAKTTDSQHCGHSFSVLPARCTGKAGGSGRVAYSTSRGNRLCATPRQHPVRQLSGHFLRHRPKANPYDGDRAKGLELPFDPLVRPSGSLRFYAEIGAFARRENSMASKARDASDTHCQPKRLKSRPKAQNHGTPPNTSPALKPCKTRHFRDFALALGFGGNARMR